MDQMYAEWASRMASVTITWDERIALFQAVRRARPDLSREMVEDLSNFELIEEAAIQGFRHPLTVRYFPEMFTQALAA